MKFSYKLTKEEIIIFASLLSEGALSGHYHKKFTDLKLSFDYLESINLTNIMPNGKKEQGSLMVFREDDTPVCFSLVCDTPFPKYSKEILLFSVVEKFRCNGIGKKAIKIIMSEAKGTKVVARCTRKSMSMVRILRACGFKNVNLGKSKSGNINLGSKLIKV